VLFERPGENEDIIQVGEVGVKFPQNHIHVALKRLGGIAQVEGHERELKEAKESGDGGLLYIIMVDGNLVVCPHQIDL
jgi:hypothetical protein